MNNRLKKAFDQIHAEEDRKIRTKAFLAEKMTQTSSSKHMARRLSIAFACVLFVFVGALGGFAYFTPTCAMSIDVNPSIELSINCFDRVIAVTGYNEDGQTVAQTLEVKHLSSKQALEKILADERITEYLNEGEEMAISVTGSDEKQAQALLQTAQGCTKNHANIDCYQANPDNVETAHAEGISFGKYQAFLELQALTDQFTIEDVKNMTMKEIKNKISELSAENTETTQDSSSHNNQNGGNNGNGNGETNGDGSGEKHQYGKQE